MKKERGGEPKDERGSFRLSKTVYDCVEGDAGMLGVGFNAALETALRDHYVRDASKRRASEIRKLGGWLRGMDDEDRKLLLRVGSALKTERNIRRRTSSVGDKKRSRKQTA